MQQISEYTPQLSLGIALRRARREVNYTQEQVAAHLGVVRTTLCAIESGQRKVSIQELTKLAELYKTSVHALVEESTAPANDLRVIAREPRVILTDRQKNVLSLLERNPRKVIARSLVFAGISRKDLEDMACALLHHLYAEESEVAHE